MWLFGETFDNVEKTLGSGISMMWSEQQLEVCLSPLASQAVGFGWNLEVWQPPRQSGKASMHMTVTQALYFLLFFFWKRYCILFSEISFASCNWRSMQL